MKILLTNDDGIYAPGLAALEQELQRIGDVDVVAPATEQSGVGHSITYLRPLVIHEVYDGDRRRGWAVEGSPADSVKLGVSEICSQRPDLVVSGINSGLNSGINVLYSGTVAAAIEGAFFGILSVAVSLEFNEHSDYPKAAILARKVIEQLVEHQPQPAVLYNLNIPNSALSTPSSVKIVPMDVTSGTENYQKRIDPRGRSYYWAASEPPHRQGIEGSDLTALAEGHLTLTPLHFDLTQRDAMSTMQDWTWTLD